MLWKEKKRSRIRAVQRLVIRRMDGFPNALRGLCGVTKGVNERIDEGVLRWFGHVERIEKERTAKSVYVGEWVGREIDGLLPCRIA